MKKTLQLQNGIRLSYSEYGPPHGFPVLIQHGLIASIEQGDMFRRLVERGARLILLARPGYGESTPFEMANLGAWGSVVRRLVADLGLARFDVFGISSGAPYSYAIARQLPERVRSVYILSGTPALYADQVLAHWPYPSNRGAALPDLQRLAYDLFFAGCSEDDLRQSDIRDSMQHECFGIAQDLRLRGMDWGFRLEEVQVPVFMRHYRGDESVPLRTAELTAQMLPDCVLEVMQAGEHFSQRILDDFIDTVIDEHLS